MTGRSAFSGLSDLSGASVSSAQVGESGEGWADITTELKQSCASLGTGGMAIRQGFTLFESMNALELMSPKMDSGMNAHEFVDIKQRFENGAFQVPPRNDVDLVCVMHQLLVMELSWYDGHSLATSVHQCLYISWEALDILRGKCVPLMERIVKEKEGFAIGETDEDELEAISLVSLALFCAVMKSCGIVRHLVRRADIFEEEDFCPSVFGLPIGQKMDNVDVLMDYAQMILAMVGKRESSKVFSKDASRVLSDMLSLRKMFMEAIEQMSSMKTIPDAEKLWDCIKELFIITGPAREGIPQVEINARERVGKMAFDPKINREVLAASPPRAVPVVDFPAAHAGFLKLVDSMLTVCALRHATTLFELYKLLEEFSATDPCIVSRSAAIPMLFTEEKLALGKYSYTDWIMGNMSEFGVPTSTVNHEAGKALASMMIKPIYEVLRIMTANRARQRRNIVNILPDWGILQREAEYQDQIIFYEAYPELMNLSAPLPAHYRSIICFGLVYWVTDWTIRLMIRHLRLGFELELYGQHETDMMIWYVQYLYSKYLDNRKEMTSYNERTLERLSDSKPTDKKQAKKLKLTIQALQNDMLKVKSNALSLKEMTMMEIENFVAAATLRFLIALRMQKKLVMPEYEFGSDEIRYNHRFAPYFHISTPVMMPYSSYVAICNVQPHDVSMLFDHTNKLYANAKTLIAQALKNPIFTASELTYLKSLLKSLITNSVTATRESTQPELGERKLSIYCEPPANFPIVKFE